MNEQPDQISGVEMDERFPSGEWRGFWLQPSMFSGRQRMSLQLSFAAGKVDGTGDDAAGNFVLKGTYDVKSGKVWMSKHYIGRHEISYQGYAELDKGIWGIWTLHDFDRGGWHIWPKGMPDPTGSTLKAEAEVPMEQAIGVLVRSPALVEAF